MNFLEELFTILQFTDMQRSEALADLDTLIKAQVTQQLIELLPNEYRNIETDINLIAKDIQRHFSKQKIDEEKQKALGIVLIAYIGYMLERISKDTQNQVRELFIKYNISADTGIDK